MGATPVRGVIILHFFPSRASHLPLSPVDADQVPDWKPDGAGHCISCRTPLSCNYVIWDT